MAENSKIEWTHHTWSPWEGCTKVSAGCANCYAANEADGRWGRVVWGPNGTRRVKAESGWKEPLKWDRAAKEAGVRLRVFPSMCDPFEDWQKPMTFSDGASTYWICGTCQTWIDGALPHIQKVGPTCIKCQSSARRLTMQDVRRRLFQLIDRTPNLDWLLLTKRPENILRMWPRYIDSGDNPNLWSCELGQEDNGSIPRYLRNVWLGTSVEDQAAADTRIPMLIRSDWDAITPIRWLSMEPMVGPVNLSRWLLSDSPFFMPRFHWVVQGGESQNGARPAHPDWMRLTRDQCQAAGIPYLFKQWGDWAPFKPGVVHVEPEFFPSVPYQFGDGQLMVRVGKKVSGRKLDGQIHDEFPTVQVS